VVGVTGVVVLLVVFVDGLGSGTGTGMGSGPGSGIGTGTTVLLSTVDWSSFESSGSKLVEFLSYCSSPRIFN